jgi:hypothetical protein
MARHQESLIIFNPPLKTKKKIVINFAPMLIIVLSIIGALVLALLVSRFSGKKNDEQATTLKVPPADCCGAHEVCEQESLLSSNATIFYYNDEELDLFRGVDAGAYSDEQIEQFREVLYTMKEDEVAGWLRSLQNRGIMLPLILREETLMIISERRAAQLTS